MSKKKEKTIEFKLGYVTNEDGVTYVELGNLIDVLEHLNTNIIYTELGELIQQMKDFQKYEIKPKP